MSSTFVDMEAERDELVKRVFPALRDLCESRGVVWGEIDLRWGITEEQVAEGHVLEICLDEIEECRPYFIGLLGERYGWIPDEIDPALLERQPWISPRASRSVTELEIVHAVLADPSTAEHAVFYFRDPDYAERDPDFREIPNAAEIERLGKQEALARAQFRCERLADLKDRIRASGLPVRENYPNPEALGDLVLEDFAALIDRRFPDGARPNPLQEERALHKAFAQSRERVYIPRPEYFERLDAHAAGAGAPLAVVGPSGVGKSALLANWATRLAQLGGSGSEVGRNGPPVIAHFVGASSSSADWTAMLRRLIAELGEVLDVSLTIPDSPDPLRDAFAAALQRAAARGPVVLVIDAVDQLEQRGGADRLTWLPHALPDNIRLVISTLAGPTLDEVWRRGWHSLEVAPLEPAECKELIARYLRQYAKQLPASLAEEIASAPQAATPLFVRVLLEELRVHGSHRTLSARLDALLAADDIPGLYQLVLTRWGADYERDRPGLVGSTMCNLWAARRGLSETELLDLLRGDGPPLPRAIWSPLYLAAKHMFVNHGGLLGFAHRYAREAVEHRYLPDDQTRDAAHLRLARYFLADSPTQPRPLDEGPWQLARAARWRELFGLLADPEVTLSLASAARSDLRGYWAELESASGERMTDAYEPVLEHPEQSENAEVSAIAELLTSAGHDRHALTLWEHLERSPVDADELQYALGSQAEILRRRGRLDEALDLLDEQQRLCREIGNAVGLQVSLGNKALILTTRGDLDDAFALLKEQERVARDHGARDVLALSLGRQAMILATRGDLDGALALRDEQELILRELGDPVALQHSLGSRALILQRRGDLDGALTLMNEQAHVCRTFGDPAGLQQALCNQGLILSGRGELDGALALYRESERICRELNMQEDLKLSLGNQAVILRKRGDLDGAIALHEQEEEIARELGSPEGIEQSIGNRVAILLERGDHEHALELVEERERICRQLGLVSALQSALGDHALILRSIGNLDRAVELLEDQLRICRELDEPYWLQRALGNYGMLMRLRGQLEPALAAMKEQLRICRELGNLEGIEQSLGNQALVAQDQGNAEKALLLLEQQEQISRQLGKPASLQGALGNRAVVLMDRGDLDEALSLLREQEQICRGLANLEGLRCALGNQASVLRRRGDHGSALPLIEEDVDISRRLGNAKWISESVGTLGDVLSAIGDHRRALAVYTEREQICREQEAWGDVVKAQTGQAVCLARLGRADEAVRVAERAKDLAQEHELTELMGPVRSVHRRLRIAKLLGGVGSRKTSDPDSA